MNVTSNKLLVSAVAACALVGVALGQTNALASSQSSNHAAGRAGNGASQNVGAPQNVGASQNVIVTLHDQLSQTPATKADIATRAAKATSEQNSVLSHVSGPAVTHVKHFGLANAFAATMTAAQVAALQQDPAVASVIPDASIRLADTVSADPAAGAASPGRAAKPGAPAADGPYAVCPSDPSKPLVEPEGLQSMHVYSTDGTPYAQQLTTGAGTRVAFIADGIDPNNPDFIGPNGRHVIVDYKDFSGDGPDAPTGGGEAFGDASSIAAQGLVAHDLSTFVNPAYPLPAGCNIRILGVAPSAQLVAIKAGGEFLTNSSILQSIDYAVRVDHVDVINESFGLNQFPDDSSRNTIKLFNDQAVAAGVTVTESTGDAGINGTVGSDAQDPQVISVGATTNARLYEQTGYAGARAFGNGQWVNDNISALSSAGVTQFGRTQDVVAPGEAGWAACEPGFGSCVSYRNTPTDIEAFGGTSQSSPFTAGVAALVISEYRSTHGGASPTPAVVKQIIAGTATDLGLPPAEQGSGLVNARAAVEAAATWGTSSSASKAQAAHLPANIPANIVTSTDQVTLTGTPGSTQGGSLTVTNVGNTSTQVVLGTRAFNQISASGQALAFDSTTLPTFPYPTNGAPWAYKQVHFQVVPGTARTVVRMAWAGSRPPAPDAIVRVSLFAPDGAYVANSRPQGGAATANYATVDVRQPASGTWTAVLYSPAGAAGYQGVVGLAVDNYATTPIGTISPSTFTLAAGASRSVHYSFPMSSSASGDQTYAITLGDSAGRTSAVGVVVRTLIDTSSGHATFSGDVTGGNARGVSPGETFSYQFNVPANAPSLDASVKFKNNPNSAIDLVLIDPNGELGDVVTNETVNAAKTALDYRSTIQSFTANPVPGTWHLVVVVQNPVSGTEFDGPYTGAISFDPVPVTAKSLPTSTSTVLARGQAYTATVDVTNSGVQPILVGADPRLNKMVNLQPALLAGQLTFALPPDPSQEPVYTMPPDTSSLSVSAVSTTPAQLELQSSAAGIDLFGSLSDAQNGDLVSTTSVAENGPRSFISKGLWYTNMQQIGPFTDAGPPAGQTTITASMHTLAFDNAVTSSTGDPFGNAVDPHNNGFGNVVRINPGDTKTITVTITPTAAIGSTVSGLLNLVTVANLPTGTGGLPFYTTGEVIAALPYAYTVGPASS